MTEFQIYLRLGFDHLVDINGVDHILFIVALCTGFSWSDWKRLIALVSFFTVGHSITLALATLEIVQISSILVEILIPVTILATAGHAFATRNKRDSGNDKREDPPITLYLLTAFFGLIHGLGFSNYLRALLGSEESILLPLLSFNIGLELGQIVVVIAFVSLASIVQKSFRLRASVTAAGLSLIVAAWSGYMIIERLLQI